MAYSDIVSSDNTSALTAGKLAYKTFTGADISCFINNKRVGSLQAVTVSVTREIQPIYVMGDPNPKAFAKGKRGIAGSLVFSQFDRDALLHDVFSEFTDKRSDSSTTAGLWRWLQDRGYYSGAPENVISTEGYSIMREMAGNLQKEYEQIRTMVGQRVIQYADQIPPFNISITMVSEEGAAAAASIYGVQLINQGFGWSLDDITNEAAYTFVCRSVMPLTSLIATASAEGNVGSVELA